MWELGSKNEGEEWQTFTVMLKRANGEFGLDLNRFARVRKQVKSENALGAEIKVFDRITHVNGTRVNTTLEVS